MKPELTTHKTDKNSYLFRLNASSFENQSAKDFVRASSKSSNSNQYTWFEAD